MTHETMMKFNNNVNLSLLLLLSFREFALFFRVVLE